MERRRLRLVEQERIDKEKDRARLDELTSIVPKGTNLTPINYNHRDFKKGDTIAAWQNDTNMWLFLKLIEKDERIWVHPSDMHGNIIMEESPFEMALRFIFSFYTTNVYKVTLPDLDPSPAGNVSAAAALSPVVASSVPSPAAASPATASLQVPSGGAGSAAANVTKHTVKPSCSVFGCFRRGGSRRNRKNKRKGSHTKRKQTRRRR